MKKMKKPTKKMKKTTPGSCRRASGEFACEGQIEQQSLSCWLFVGCLLVGCLVNDNVYAVLKSTLFNEYLGPLRRCSLALTHTYGDDRVNITSNPALYVQYFKLYSKRAIRDQQN